MCVGYVTINEGIDSDIVQNSQAVHQSLTKIWQVIINHVTFWTAAFEHCNHFWEAHQSSNRSATVI